MKSHRHDVFVVAVAVLTCCASLPAAGRASFRQSPTAWFTFVPADEEFTVEVPAGPTFRAYPMSRSVNYKPDQEPLLAHWEYSGYGSGLIYIIQSFKAARPQKLTTTLHLIERSDVFERELSFDGIVARQYRRIQTVRQETYTRRNIRFTASNHLYVITLASLEENNSAADRFLSSLRLRKPGDSVTPMESAPETSSDPPLAPADVTRRAVVVWKSEPLYTDDARTHQVTGTVVLEAVFGANGYMKNITVTKGLEHGLTQSAIDAARNIRFFPAEKDGKPVSQRTMLEYSFNLF